MLNYRVLIAFVGVTIISVAGGIYLTASNKAETLSHNSHSTVIASVWDQPTVSYTGIDTP